MRMTTAEVLKAARALIEDPKHWTRGVMARTAPYGRLTSPKSSEAQCWCALGAIVCVAGFIDSEGANDALYQIVGPTAQFNDNHTHSEVLAAFDKAIALAESRNS